MAHKPTIAKDTPLAELTLRKYERPTSSGRDLVRKVCLTLGLLYNTGIFLLFYFAYIARTYISRSVYVAVS